MRISHRLMLNAVAMSLFSVLITSSAIGWIAYSQGSNVIKKNTMEHLISMREIKKDEIERYFNNTREEILALANDFTVIEAMKSFKASFKTYKDELDKIKPLSYNMNVIQKYIKSYQTEYKIKNSDEGELSGSKLFNLSRESSFSLQYNYILQNPYPIGKKQELNYVDDGTSYSQTHKKYHPRLNYFLKKLHYYDIFLIDDNSLDIVYTVYKEPDFTTSLIDGAFSNTGIAEVAKAIQKLNDQNATVLSDFAPYAPSYDGEAAFIGAPIYDGNVKIGILAVQLPINVINQIMTNKERWQEVGLGETGETYLVGPDFRLRSMSRFFTEHPDDYLNMMSKIGISDAIISEMRDKNTSIGLQPVSTKGVENALRDHETGFGIFKDYRQIPVLSAYAPLNIPGLNWAIMSEIDEAEAFKPVYLLAIRIILFTAIVSFVMVFSSILIAIKLAWKISKPMEQISRLIQFISKDKDLTKRLPINSKDELGEISMAINDLFDSLQQAFEETVHSTTKVNKIAFELEELSGKIKNRPSNNVDKPNEFNIDKLMGKKGKELKVLSTKLRKLAKQFQIMEEKTDEMDTW